MKKIAKSIVFMLIIALMIGINMKVFAADTPEPTKTLQEQINDSEGSVTITLDKSYSESITIAENKTVIIDLNGNNITATSRDAISNKGDLTIKGDGTISAGSAAIVNYPGATAKLVTGTYKSTSWYCIKNLGTMTIDGISFSNGSNTASLIDNGWAGGTAQRDDDRSQAFVTDGAKLTINGGDFTTIGSSCNVIKNDDGGVLTINGGTFYSKTQPNVTSINSVLLNWHKATIKGGTFKVDNALVVSNGYLDDIMDAGQLTIEGGTFIGKGQNLLGVGGGALNGGKLTIKGGDFQGTLGNGHFPYAVEISGGTYTEEVNAEKIAAGYICAKTDSGYIVKKPSTGSTTPATSTNPENPSNPDKPGSTGTPVVPEDKIETSAPQIDTNKPVDEVQTGVVDEKVTGNTLVDSLQEAVKANNDLANAVEGKKVDVDVEIKNNVKIDNEQKNNIESAAKKVNSNIKVASYFDVAVVIKANGTKVGELANLNRAIRLAVALPENLRQVPSGYVRTYYIVRDHEGKVDMLDASLSGDGKFLVFDSDKFSTYGLAYVDEKAGSNNNGNANNANGNSSNGKDETPKTGDHIYVATFGLIASLAVMGVSLKKLYVK